MYGSRFKAQGSQTSELAVGKQSRAQTTFGRARKMRSGNETVNCNEGSRELRSRVMGRGLGFQAESIAALRAWICPLGSAEMLLTTPVVLTR